MSPFGSKKSIEVLETKFNIYEDLSRQMLNKLEAAVDKISETNSNIANILTKHDERIEQTIKNDQIFLKQIDELKIENKEDHDKVCKRIEKLEIKIDDIVKFRWISVGAVIIISFLLTLGFGSSTIIDVINPQVNIERNK